MTDNAHIPCASLSSIPAPVPFTSSVSTSLVSAWRHGGLAFRLMRRNRTLVSQGRLPPIDPFEDRTGLPSFVAPATADLDRAERKRLNLPSRVCPDLPLGVSLGGIGAGFGQGSVRGGGGLVRSVPLLPDGIIPAAEVDHRRVCQVSLSLPKRAPRAVVLCARGREDGGRCSSDSPLASWGWFADEHDVMWHQDVPFPRMRHTFHNLHEIKGLSVTQEFLSPALPRDYVDASLPVSVIRITVRNDSDEPLLHGASVMLSWLNGDGSPDDVGGGMVHELLDEREAGVVGVAMHARRAHCTRDRDGQLTVNSADRYTHIIGAETSADTEVTVCEEFRASDAGDAATLWAKFSETGHIERISHGSTHGSEPGSALASAIAVYLPSVAVGETKEITFVVARNAPLVRFGDGSAFRRRHAALFNASHAATNRALLRLSMSSWRRWLSDIEAWQQPVLANDALPLDYRRALFNELYYLSVGGALWLASKDVVPGDYDVDLTDSVDAALANWQAARSAEYDHSTVGQFLYLEGIEYTMYNTVDVHFYASFALVSNWPLLNMSLLVDVADATLAVDDEVVPMLYAGGTCPRSVRAAVPHDLGSPSDQPWLRSNCYELHDTSRWLDLGPKFVLMAYRDYAASGDLAFARRVWPAVQASMRHSAKFDMDEDGLPDSYGRPDTTYDEACAVGAATYPGVLWVAAQAAAAALATALGHDSEAKAFEEGRATSAAAVERLLWTGRYYRLDSSLIPKGSVLEQSPVMADALVGDLYCRVSGLPEAVPLANARRHLQTVRELNVLRFGTGRQGAVNRMNPNGTVDTASLQSAEVWTGSTFAVAAHMVLAGLDSAGLDTVGAFVHHLHSDLPYLFNTPEALDGADRYRSLSYMRPLAIWAVQWAVDQREREAGSQDTEDMT